jgi:D-alanine transaminase
MDALGYYNGQWGPLDDMTIPMNDRGNYFGDGVYDAAICANRVIFTLDEHIDRFFTSARGLEIKPSCGKDELKAILVDLAGKADNVPLLVYWQWTRGTARREHAFSGGKTNLMIMLKPLTVPDIYRKVKFITHKDTRFLHCNIKTINLIPNVIAAQRAKEQGAHEAVLYREGGIVTESSHGNVHIIKDGTFITHPADELILRGITREHLLSICRRLGIPVLEREYSLEELFKADEILTSSATTFALAADFIDGKPAGGKAPDLLKEIQDGIFGEFLAATGWTR